MEEEIFNLATKQIQLAISNALNNLTNTSKRSLRCRSSSSYINKRKLSFYTKIPRYSIPTTKYDLIYYQTNSNEINKTFDCIQYSFSINKPLLTKRQENLLVIQNFVDEFIQNTIESAFIQLSDESHPISDDESHPISDDEPSVTSIDNRHEGINSYVDQLIDSSIEQAIEHICLLEIQMFSNRLTEDIIIDALGTIVDIEVYSKTILLTDDEKIKKKSISEQPIINNYESNEESINSIVNNLAQQIYLNSFDQLKQIFTTENNNGH